MHISSVEAANFRNYLSVSASFDEGIHIFCGENAQGKTNLLEALYLPVLGRSFRASNDEEMIHWESDKSKVQVNYCNRIAEHTAHFLFQRGHHKQLLVNGQKIRPKEMVGRMNMVIFCPEDMQLIKGAPSLRRRFIDMQLSQTDPVYFSLLQDYHRLLFQRNNLLKKIRDEGTAESLLDSWDLLYCQLCFQIVSLRKEYIVRLTLTANRMNSVLSDGSEGLSSQYVVHGFESLAADDQVNKESFVKKIFDGRRKDIIRGHSEFGPHKDDVTLFLNGHDARAYASQGQQRSIILSLKLAEVEMIKQDSGDYPVLLLDDVMSELDGERRSRLVKTIAGKIQCFITGTEGLNAFAEFDPRWYYIQDGQIIRRNA
jgi:DNA replication and repair protein RecF